MWSGTLRFRIVNEGPRTHILVVEDEPKVAMALGQGLLSEGYDVAVALTGEEGLSQAESRRFDLVILDWMLPGRSGLEVLETMQQRVERCPVLLLTARDAVEDRVAGLDAGADDYLVKPFAFPELLARVRALLRRGRGDAAHLLRCADVQLDRVGRSVTRGGRPVELTFREFELLDYLLVHRGHLVSREMLVRDVWKEPDRATTLDNVIDVTMARLRKKIDADPAARLIHTVRGVGFLLREGGP